MNRHYRFSPVAAGVLFSFLALAGCGSDSTTLVADGSGTDTQAGADTTETTGNTDGDSASGSDVDGSDSNGADTDGGGDSGTDSDNTNPDGTVSNSEYEARYRATFNATWSAATHPVNFPGNPHFSPLTGAVHSEQSRIWESGQIASDGIEQMAETGGTAILATEIQAVVDEGRALSLIAGGGVQISPGSTSVEFTINRDNSLLTLVSMMAPSPDWFIGVNGVPLIDQNGDFVQSIAVDLPLYDSGTDGGMRFTSADEDTSPRSPISLVNSFPFDTDFVEGEPYAGQLIIEKI